MAELKAYKKKHSPSTGGCFIGSTFKAQEMNSKVHCFSGADSPSWSKAADTFWKKPSEDWYETKKYLRLIVTQTNF